MHVSKIELVNFRCFPVLEVAFHRRLTTLVAPNGGGKTTVLDALSYVLSVFVGEFDKNQRREPDPEDLRVILKDDGTSVPAYLSGVAMDLDCEGWPEGITCIRSLTKERISQEENLAIHARDMLKNLGSERPSSDVVLPVVAYYGSKRTVAAGRYEVGWELGNAALRRDEGYGECLVAAANADLFRIWYGKAATAELAVQQSRSRREAIPPAEQRLAERAQAVKKTIDGVLNGTSEQRRYELRLLLSMGQVAVLDNEQGVPLGLHQLSDGVHSVLTLVGDLAARCAVLNPHLGADAPSETPGIVLIDEVDLHLHPAWQQRVLVDLQNAFPKIQFIVTTHSPQVLSTVPKECIRILGRTGDGQWVAEEPAFQTRGVQSTDVLAEIMGIDPVPPVDEARWVDDYRAIIENDQDGTPEAEGLRARMVGHFGKDHPVVLDCERLRRFKAFRPRKGQ